jgi:hypothetical protein
VSAAALLIGWWYSTLAWRWRAHAFAGVWTAVVAIGAVVVTLDTPRCQRHDRSARGPRDIAGDANAYLRW